MTYETAKALFSGAGLTLSESHFAQFQCYLTELVEVNRHMNLTAITEPGEVWEKHFLDSAILLQKVTLPLGASCIDVGTGAGFPGMVLAIRTYKLHCWTACKSASAFWNRRRQGWDWRMCAAFTPEPRTAHRTRNSESSSIWQLPEPWQPCRC